MIGGAWLVGFFIARRRFARRTETLRLSGGRADGSQAPDPLRARVADWINLAW